MSNISLTSPKRLANAPIFRSTNRHVHIELQLANTPFMALSRSSQNTTSSGCIERLILGSYNLNKYKISSLILIYTLQLFESNVAGRKQSVCEREQIKGNLRSVVIMREKPRHDKRTCQSQPVRNRQRQRALDREIRSPSDSVSPVGNRQRQSPGSRDQGFAIRQPSS